MRIAFFVRQRFHDAILRPIYHCLQERHSCLMSSRFNEIVKFAPQVVVQGEGAMQIERLRGMLPATIIVHTRHGLAAKNVTYQGVAQSDYTCLTSDWVRDQYLLQNTQPRRAFWITGSPQFDSLFGGQAAPLDFSVPETHQRVLIAPTYNSGLTCVPLLDERALRRLFSPHRTVILKPHPHTLKHFPRWFAMCRELSAREEHFHFVSDAHQNLTPYLLNADVLISDASSAALEFLALNRPMILINNPARWNDPHFDPRGLEWRWRDMGEELENVEQLPEVLDAVLQNPLARSQTRLHYRKLLFGENPDGNSAFRIAQKIEELQPVLDNQTKAGALKKTPPPTGRWF